MKMAWILIIFFLILPAHAGKKKLQKVKPSPHRIMVGQIHHAAQEYAKLKTAKDMMNTGKGQIKLLRRKIFADNPEKPMPPIFQTGPLIRIYVDGLKKKPDLFYGVVQSGKIHYFYNGNDVTRKKGENSDAWMKRLSVYSKTPVKSKKKQKTSWLESLMFPEAWAFEDNYFSNNPILASFDGTYDVRDGYNNQPWRERLMQYFATATGQHEWFEQYFDGSNNPFHGEIDHMKQNHLYRCDPQQHGYSTIYINDVNGTSHEVTVESFYDFQSKMLNVRLYPSMNGRFKPDTKPLGRMAFKTNEEGRTTNVYYACDKNTICEGNVPPTSMSTSGDAALNLETMLGFSLDRNEGANAGAAIEALGAFGAGCCTNNTCINNGNMDQRPRILPRGEAPSANR